MRLIIGKSLALYVSCAKNERFSECYKLFSSRPEAVRISLSKLQNATQTACKRRFSAGFGMACARREFLCALLLSSRRQLCTAARPIVFAKPVSLAQTKLRGDFPETSGSSSGTGRIAVDICGCSRSHLRGARRLTGPRTQQHDHMCCPPPLPKSARAPRRITGPRTDACIAITVGKGEA